MFPIGTWYGSIRFNCFRLIGEIEIEIEKYGNLQFQCYRFSFIFIFGLRSMQMVNVEVYRESRCIKNYKIYNCYRDSIFSGFSSPFFRFFFVAVLCSSSSMLIKLCWFFTLIKVNFNALTFNQNS